MMFYRLPFQTLPRILIAHLVLTCTAQSNCFLAKHGISGYFSPRMILHQEHLTYQRHTKHYFGDYVQAYSAVQATNTMQPRIIDCIYIKPSPNWQGGHMLHNIQTNKTIVRSQIIKTQITQSVINKIKIKAEQDQMPSSIETYTKFQPHHLIKFTGVDGEDDGGMEENEDTVDDEDDGGMEEHEDIQHEIQSYEPPKEKSEHSNPDKEETKPNATQEKEKPNWIDIFDSTEESNSESDLDLDDPGYKDLWEQLAEAENQYNSIQDINENPEVTLDHITNEEQQQTTQNTQPTPRGKVINESETCTRMRTENPSVNYITAREIKVRIPEKYMHLHISKNGNREECGMASARIIALVMQKHNDKMSNHVNIACSQTYNLKQGINKFGATGKKAVTKEMKQLLDRNVFSPIHSHELTESE